MVELCCSVFIYIIRCALIIHKVLLFLLGPEMYVNGNEVMSTVLIDDDSDTCITLDGSYGCGMDKVDLRRVVFYQ